MSEPFSVLDLVLHGRLGAATAGLSRDEVHTLLGVPDDWSGAQRERAAIWRYGSFEAHFDRDRVLFLFSDHLSNLDAGPGRNLDRWILGCGSTPTLPVVFDALRALDAPVSKRQIKVGDSFVPILRVDGGADLWFDPLAAGAPWASVVAHAAASRPDLGFIVG